MMKSVILLGCLFVLTLHASFDISSSSTCTNYSSGFCTRWEQNGTVQEQMGSCFPATAQLMTPSGLVQIKDIKKGDFVLGWFDGKEQFSKVTSWFHHNEQGQHDYVSLVVGQGRLEVSHKHNIALGDLQYTFAEEALGKKLFIAGMVKEMNQIQATGKYAPKTESNNYFVYLQGNSKEKVLAHCFAHIRNPQNYEFIFSTIESTWELLFDTSSDLIHPSYSWMQTHFALLTE